MNPLTEQDLDKTLLNRGQKPMTRGVLENYVLPAGGMAGRGVLAALNAIANIKRAPNVYQVK